MNKPLLKNSLLNVRDSPFRQCKAKFWAANHHIAHLSWPFNQGWCSLRILVTGGLGFLGKVLVQQLQNQSYETIATDSKTCDLSQERSLEYLESVNPDFIFHLAGKTGIVSSWQNPVAYYHANLDTIRNVLEYCRKKKIPMHFVSGYVYGNLGDIPLSEKMTPIPNNPYAHSKWMSEELCRFYSQSFSLPITISRPFNIYGPKQSSDFFIPRMIQQLQTQEEIFVRDLKPKRDYVFVEDVADAMIAIMHRGKPGNCYNIGSGVCLSCSEVIEEIQTLMKIHKPVHSEHQTRPEEILHAQADIAKINSELDWSPKHSLQNGLAKCL